MLQVKNVQHKTNFPKIRSNVGPKDCVYTPKGLRRFQGISLKQLTLKLTMLMP